MLIDEEWVLSAAHCMSNPNFEVVFGAHSMSTTTSTWQVRPALAVYNHPLYDAATTNYDFALVRIAPVELGSCVGTVCLPTAGDVSPGKKCWITGWGTLSAGGDQPDIHQEGAVNIISNKACTSTFGYSASQITEQMLCAQGTTANGDIVDACQGDSGGPLVCETGGVWTVYGATSWGRGCAGARYPGIWARVHEQLDWIEDTMANPPPPPTRPPAVVCDTGICRYSWACFLSQCDNCVKCQ
jgi:secreted trypsin-like serine protease